MTSAASTAAPTVVGTAPEWPALVKAALSPRLVRLPILTLVFLHLALALVHLPTSPHSTLDAVLFALRPTLFLCSLLAFLTGILPTLVLRRRILARSAWQAALCPPTVPQQVRLPLGVHVSAATPAGQALYRLCLPSTWLSAALEGLTSLVGSAFLLASFAAFSPEPTWWLPYQRVPSTRRSTGAFGRTITTTTHHWRPNEAVWLLLLQPLLLGVAASLLATILPEGRWSIPPLRVPQFPTSLITCLPASVGTASSTSSTLSRRVSLVVSPLVFKAALHYLLLSAVLLLLYLPLRLPSFRLLLLLLPPYSPLRRLVIPSLRSGFSLTTASHLATLFLTSSASALVQGATRCLAINLWEIYATHPLGITANQVASPMARGGSGKSLEVMIGALEKYAPRSTPPRHTAQESEAERTFLFTHALFDFAALCTDTTTQGDQVRRAFFKHFAVPTIAPAAAGATVSAWERVSEVLLAVVESTVGRWEKGDDYVALAQDPGTELSSNKRLDSSVAIAARSKGKELEVVKGGVVGSAPPGVNQGLSSAVTSLTTSEEASRTTVWQRLIAPSPAASSASSFSPSRGVASEAPPPSAPAATAPSSISVASALAPLASTLQMLGQRSLALLPNSVARLLLLKSTFTTVPTHSASSSSTSALLHLLLIAHAAYTLLLLSLAEDEWGSVTLSERRSLGVERWASLGARVERAALSNMGGSAVEDGQAGKGDKDGQSSATSQEDGRDKETDDPLWEWKLLFEEVKRGREAVAREFGLAP